jgi:CRP-like cAMP-binding protein
MVGYRQSDTRALATERYWNAPAPRAESLMSDLPEILFRTWKKLERRAELQEADRAALLRLPFRLRSVGPSQYIVREGDLTNECCLIVDGFAYRQKTTVEGARQILSIHMPGDFVDLEASLLRQADHNIQTLARCELAMVPVAAIRALNREHPALAQAMWIDTLIDGSIFREWILNIGQRDAKARVAHILCEFAKRLELAGLGTEAGYEFPLTQEQLGDATGLTPVHINRTLKALEKDGLIFRKRRLIQIPNWQRLRDIAGFSETYLHLDQLSA